MFTQTSEVHRRSSQPVRETKQPKYKLFLPARNMDAFRQILLLLVLTATCSLGVARRNGRNVIAGAAGLRSMGVLVDGALDGHHRRRRSVVDPSLQSRIDDMVDESAVMDELGCAARLICELHQRPFDALDDIQRRLVQLFDGSTVPVYDQIDQPKSAFHYAALVGSSRRKDAKVCARTFPKCPMNADAIMKAFQ